MILFILINILCTVIKYFNPNLELIIGPWQYFNVIVPEVSWVGAEDGSVKLSPQLWEEFLDTYFNYLQ
jgi:hypothetical protein